MGFIPLVSYQNQDFAVFFSSQAVREPNLLLIDAKSRANERLGASLANIMLACRFAHYLKCILRDNLGKNTTPEKMKAELAKLSPVDAASAEKQHFCPVSGDMLGAMGAPIKVDVDGQQVWICCEGCRDSLLENPDEYLAKLKKE